MVVVAGRDDAHVRIRHSSRAFLADSAQLAGRGNKAPLVAVGKEEIE